MSNGLFFSFIFSITTGSRKKKTEKNPSNGPLDSQRENIGQWIASDAATGSDKDSQHTGSESQTEKWML